MRRIPRAYSCTRTGGLTWWRCGTGCGLRTCRGMPTMRLRWPNGIAAWRPTVQGGRWRPAMGNSDAHLENQIGIPQTVVLAEELSIDAVLDLSLIHISEPT